MGNPLLFVRPLLRPKGVLRRLPVRIPTDTPTTDAIFLMLRRMRWPLISLILVFSVSVFGLAATPGVDPDGQPRKLSVFESFYVMSYTATTIGFGEIPYPFTTQQRLWVTLTIYATVIVWAFAIGTMLALFQDETFRDAVHGQRFARKVRLLRDEFHIVAGYGQSGRMIGKGLDRIGRRFVVIDRHGGRVDSLGTEGLSADVPGLEADAANPAVLGMAGLGSSYCSGVLAVTDDDDVNLAIVQAVHLLRPEVPVIARCSDRDVAEHMTAFGAAAIINSYDRFGTYLALALRRPAVYQLIAWLMSPTGTGLPDRGEQIPHGTWVVCAEGQFRDEIARDLRAEGYAVEFADVGEGHPDLSHAVGFVGGTDKDTLNLALAAEVRTAFPDVFICLRQSSTSRGSLYEAFSPDSLFVPTDLVGREAFSRICTPRTWAFLEYVMEQEEAWAEDLVRRVVDRCGSGSPEPYGLTIDFASAPAVVRWLQHHPATVGDLLRRPDNRDEFTANFPVSLTRDGRSYFDPGHDMPLQEGDELLLASRRRSFTDIRDVLFNDGAIEYVVTGNEVPSTWIWRKLTRRGYTTA